MTCFTVLLLFWYYLYLSRALGRGFNAPSRRLHWCTQLDSPVKRTWISGSLFDNFPREACSSFFISVFLLTQTMSLPSKQNSLTAFKSVLLMIIWNCGVSLVQADATWCWSPCLIPVPASVLSLQSRPWSPPDLVGKDPEDTCHLHTEAAAWLQQRLSAVSMDGLYGRVSQRLRNGSKHMTSPSVEFLSTVGYIDRLSFIRCLQEQWFH